MDTPNHHAGRRRWSGRRPRSFIASEALSRTWWQVKDSNLRSFRDGFTVPRRQDRDQCKRLTRNNFRAYSPQIADDHRLPPDTSASDSHSRRRATTSSRTLQTSAYPARANTSRDRLSGRAPPRQIDSLACRRWRISLHFRRLREKAQVISASPRTPRAGVRRCGQDLCQLFVAAGHQTDGDAHVAAPTGKDVEWRSGRDAHSLAGQPDDGS
jgi:hypothetical protein